MLEIEKITRLLEKKKSWSYSPFAPGVQDVDQPLRQDISQKCEQCGKELGTEKFLVKGKLGAAGPICGDCVRLHKKKK